MKNYKVASEEGVVWLGQQELMVAVGDTVKLELTSEQETAVVAAGWLEKAKKGD